MFVFFRRAPSSSLIYLRQSESRLQNGNSPDVNIAEVRLNITDYKFPVASYIFPFRTQSHHLEFSLRLFPNAASRALDGWLSLHYSQSCNEIQKLQNDDSTGKTYRRPLTDSNKNRTTSDNRRDPRPRAILRLYDYLLRRRRGWRWGRGVRRGERVYARSVVRSSAPLLGTFMGHGLWAAGKLVPDSGLHACF